MRPPLPTHHHRMRGLTLIECMIALTLGLLVILASSALLLSTQTVYLTVDDSARIDDNGNHALASIAAAVRQAGYIDHASPLWNTRIARPLFGLDDAHLSAGGTQQGIAPGINGSDVLITRFMAADANGNIDHAMLNCAGASLSTPIRHIDDAWNWSSFYIATDSSGEPELFCQYRSRNGSFTAGAIARGIEAMQILYGLDLTGDGLPNRFLNANAINAFGNASTKSDAWRTVVALQIALLVRGQQRHTTIGDSAIIDLFSPVYSARHAADDRGVQLDPKQFRATERMRMRRIFRSTIVLPNRIAHTP